MTFRNGQIPSAADFNAAFAAKTTNPTSLTAKASSIYGDELVTIVQNGVEVSAKLSLVGGGAGPSLPYINVDDYGADPTGSVSSNSAFNAAWSAFIANSAYKIFYMPGSVYKFTSPLVLDYSPRSQVPCTILGNSSSQTRLNFPTASTTVPFKVYSSSFSGDYVGFYNLDIQNVTIYHNSTVSPQVQIGNLICKLPSVPA